VGAVAALLWVGCVCCLTYTISPFSPLSLHKTVSLFLFFIDAVDAVVVGAMIAVVKFGRQMLWWPWPVGGWCGCRQLHIHCFVRVDPAAATATRPAAAFKYILIAASNSLFVLKVRAPVSAVISVEPVTHAQLHDEFYCRSL
jgi:hypothetical protein